MRTLIITIVLFVSTSCFGQNFIISGNTEYTGCNSLGKVTLFTSLTDDSIQYLMTLNDCNFPLRPLQTSTVFDSLPPCHYTFKAFNKNGDSAEISVKVGLQFKALFTTPCDSNASMVINDQSLLTSFTLYNYTVNSNVFNGNFNPPYTLKIKNRGNYTDEYILTSIDTNIFSIIYNVDVSNTQVFYLSDGCGDSDSSLYKGLLEFPTLQLQKDCNNNYILESSINNAYTNFPNSPFTYKWFQNGLLLNDTSSSLVFNRFNPNDQFLSVINYDRCVFVSEKIQSIDTSSSLLDYRLEKSNAALCRNDSVNLKIVNQGLSDIKVSWDTGSFNDSTWVYKPGFYKAFIENDLGCRDTLLVEIKSSDPRLIANKQDNKCFAAFSSSIDLNLSGGIFPFRYTWSDSVFIEDRINIRNGTYWLHISDSIGCTLDTTFTITSPTSLGLNLTAHAASCAPARDGKVTSSVTGGKPPYDIHWSNGLKVYDVDTLSVGIYTITATDSNLCTTAFTFSIDDLSPLRGNSIDTICAGGTLSIGSKKYTSPGRYIDTLTSVKGCDSVHITNLTINPVVDFILMAKDPSCNGLEDGIISLTNITGFPGYTYFLNDNKVIPDFLKSLKSGNYTVKLQDRFGCFKEKGIALSNAEKIEFSIGNDTLIDFGDTLKTKPITNLGSSSIKSIKWNTSPDNGSCNNCLQTFSYRPTSDHTLRATLTNATGCEATDEIQIRVNLDFKTFVPNIFKPLNPNFQQNQYLTVMAGRQVVGVRYFRIFNRFGDQLFESRSFAPNDTSAGWDGNFKGQAVPQGVYVYLAEVEYSDGRTGLVKGDFTLLR